MTTDDLKSKSQMKRVEALRPGTLADEVMRLREENARHKYKSEKYNELLLANETLHRTIATLRKEVEAAPVVYCRNDDGKWACDEHKGFARVTHTARLVRIEEIGK